MHANATMPENRSMVPDALLVVKTLALPAIGHWGRCPSTSNDKVFSSLRSRAKSIAVNSIWFPILNRFKTCEFGNERRSITLRKQIVFVIGQSSALPRTPLGELTTLPLNPQSAREGIPDTGDIYYVDRGYTLPILHPIHAFGVFRIVPLTPNPGDADATVVKEAAVSRNSFRRSLKTSLRRSNACSALDKRFYDSALYINLILLTCTPSSRP